MLSRMLACALWLLLSAPLAAQPILLLGETHDNAAQHELRRADIEALLRGGARPALLFEQFDRERQPALDRLFAATPRPDADAVIAAGSGAAPSGGPTAWNWRYYRPVIELALAYELPIVAANVSRADARRVIADGLAPAGFDGAVPPDLLRAQADAVQRGHCGTLDAPQAQRLALAQIARDQQMARLIAANAERGVVLLAGNGHVRTDIGVARWLPTALRARTTAVGWLEASDGGDVDGDRAAYDRVVVTPPAPRADPCAALTAPR